MGFVSEKLPSNSQVGTIVCLKASVAGHRTTPQAESSVIQTQLKNPLGERKRTMVEKKRWMMDFHD
jgi:hypothetical protein